MTTKYLKRKVSIDKLITLLGRTREWKRDYYTLEHESGISLWVCNGRSSLRLERTLSYSDEYFTFFESVALWPHIKKCRQANPYDSQYKIPAVDKAFKYVPKLRSSFDDN